MVEHVKVLSVGDVLHVECLLQGNVKILHMQHNSINSFIGLWETRLNVKPVLVVLIEHGDIGLNGIGMLNQNYPRQAKFMTMFKSMEHTFHTGGVY